MNELRLRAVREPDAPPEYKVAAASGWARSGQRRLPEIRGVTRRGVVWLFDPLSRPTAAPGLDSLEGPRVQGPRGGRVRGQQEGTSGTRLWGPGGGGISAAQKGARGVLRTLPASCPSPPEAFLGVKTSRPESLLWPVTPLSRT